MNNKEAKIEVTVKEKGKHVILIDGAIGGQNRLIFKGLASVICGIADKLVKDKKNADEWIDLVEDMINRLRKEVIDNKAQSLIRETWETLFDEDEEED